MNYKEGIFRPPRDLAWLVLDLNSFFASCEQQENPELRGKPVAVLPTMAETTCAIAASYEAKAFGIRTGTLVKDIRRLCPQTIFVPARHKLYVEYHHRIRAAIETCIPIADVMSIDEVACPLDRVERDPASAYALALKIKNVIREQVGACLTSSIGIASNKFLAKLASNMQKPDGLILLRPQDLPNAILHLELRAIPGIGPGMEARLQNAGLETMEKLWAAKPDYLRRVWGGICGLKFHALLHGCDLRSPAHPRRSISHQHVLAPQERTVADALPIMRGLLAHAAERLRREGFYCSYLGIDIKWAHRKPESGGDVYWFDTVDFQQTQDTKLMLEALANLWVRVPPLRPWRLGVVLGGLTPVAAHQPDLFTPVKKKSPVAHLVDKLNAKYGRETIGYGVQPGVHKSKIAFQRVPDLAEF